MFRFSGVMVSLKTSVIFWMGKYVWFWFSGRAPMTLSSLGRIVGVGVGIITVSVGAGMVLEGVEELSLKKTRIKSSKKTINVANPNISSDLLFMIHRNKAVPQAIL